MNCLAIKHTLFTGLMDFHSPLMTSSRSWLVVFRNKEQQTQASELARNG